VEADGKNEVGLERTLFIKCYNVRLRSESIHRTVSLLEFSFHPGSVLQ